jgi:hypothetical protein
MFRNFEQTVQVNDRQISNKADAEKQNLILKAEELIIDKKKMMKQLKRPSERLLT